MRQFLCTVTSNVELLPSVRLMWLEAPEIASFAQPGQFITVRCKDFILRRPFSIHQVIAANEANGSSKNSANFLSEKQSQIALLFKIVGKGSLWLSQRQQDEKIDVLGPLGLGFTMPLEAPGNSPIQSKNLLLIAGGMGIAPLAFLAQRASTKHRVTLIHGAATAMQLYPFPKGKAGEQDNASPLFQRMKFVPVTEDGSRGEKGLATDILPEFLDWADQIYACGPIDMYKTMAEMSLSLTINSMSSKKEEEKPSKESKLKKCQVSLEVGLGCGIGACYGCSINNKVGLKKVCQDGPVFDLDDILWDEVKI